VLIKTVSTERLFFNELFIYRKDDSERINKDFIITKTSRVHKSIEIRQCKAFDQSTSAKPETADKILFWLIKLTSTDEVDTD
jgi:hypothetical protein